VSKEESSSEEEDEEEEEDEDEEEEGGGEADESYEHIEGAYNSKDYQHLNVAAEVRDLFQYIERYKPHEVELDTTLKCFIPEYIPAIGEIDGFVKVCRDDSLWLFRNMLICVVLLLDAGPSP
jgi:intraflagellar transport protein 46